MEREHGVILRIVSIRRQLHDLARGVHSRSAFRSFALNWRQRDYGADPELLHDYSSDAMREIDRFFREEHRIIVPLTVREILDEEIARKLA